MKNTHHLIRDLLAGQKTVGMLVMVVNALTIALVVLNKDICMVAQSRSLQ